MSAMQLVKRVGWRQLHLLLPIALQPTSPSMSSTFCLPPSLPRIYAIKNSQTVLHHPLFGPSWLCAYHPLFAYSPLHVMIWNPTLSHYAMSTLHQPSLDVYAWCLRYDWWLRCTHPRHWHAVRKLCLPETVYRIQVSAVHYSNYFVQLHVLWSTSAVQITCGLNRHLQLITILKNSQCANE